ncbi:YciI family protein [Frondihabitans australicus]|uniref:YCII-related domain-containing protein n=1 Tax=Frondihabitans australicus TaxID=386892 RepID=A0A495ILI5_9MICO|nr:YciI family protein [Frondihabitans australicus]RKR76590.1 hypothetical protein C8E83_3767 [Frondihabitans australicus]
MRYMLFICDDPTAPEYDPAQDNIEEWIADLEKRGVHSDGDRLRPPAEAKTVRVRDGETVVTDGPFTESRETVAGFDLIDVETLDEALEIAAAHPMARFGRVEVRAFWPFEG